MKQNPFLPSNGVFVVAEIGSNHNGDFDTAQSLIRKAAETGVNAVKFQIYKAENKILDSVPVVAHARGKYKNQLERFKSLEFNRSQWESLKKLADDLGVGFFASIFDKESLDEVDDLIPFYKIASGELTNIPLIREVARKGKRIILSTGFASLEEIEKAANEIPKDKLILLHCISAYPTPPEELHLNTIPFLREKFNVPVGYSDHTLGTLACLAAVSLGAVMVEKHFTLDKNQPLGDHRLSSEPEEMKELVSGIRLLEKMLGVARNDTVEAEKKMKAPWRRGLYAREDIPRDTILTDKHIIPLCPENDFSSIEIDNIIGRKTKVDLKKLSPLRREDLAAI